jgi:hypothetical protein
LQMEVATRRFGSSQQPNESAYNAAFNTSATFASVYKQRSKLQRQWQAYHRYVSGDADSNITDVLTRLDWLSLGNASVVEVSRLTLDAVLSTKSLTNASSLPFR